MAGAFAYVKRKYRFYQIVRRAPENLRVNRRDAVSPLVGRIPDRIPGLASIDRLVRTRVFIRDLQLLNDVMCGMRASACYWVWSGLLLGWAREGRVLRHDIRDADFAYAEQDEALILQGIEALIEAGFRRGFSFRDNEGVLTEHTLVRHGARFEFFRMSSVASDWEYSMFAPEQDPAMQLTARLPRQRLVPFDFLGRAWLKVLDHDRELTILYGDWRTPDPRWSYLDSGGIVERREWMGGLPSSRRPGRFDRHSSASSDALPASRGPQ